MKKVIKQLTLLILLISSTSSFLHGANAAQPEPKTKKEPRYIVDEVARDLGVPWGMTFVNDAEILYTQRDGQIGLLNTRNSLVTAISGAPKVWTGGQGGLLDVATHPGYQAGNWIYFTYCKDSNGQGVTTLARARLDQDQLIDWQELLVTQSASDTTRHFGSRIAFDNSDHLFFTVGDRGHRPNGQNLSSHAGSVLRLNLDGSVPPDNPFIDSPEALPEIWSYGHRNPQGIFFDQQNQRLWLNEHGPRGGDEINLVIKGRNYGWPIVSHGKEYWNPLPVGEATSKPGMEDPKKVYIPSIAPSSLLLYTGEAFPRWQGSLFSGALKLTHLNRVTVDETGNIVAEEWLLEDLNERIRQVVQSSEGWLYVSTDSGKILRIKPE
jgi:glucose/arabinose dehydrogenase